MKDAHNNTAWYNDHMSDHMINTCFPHISRSDHFGAIKKCISHIYDAKSIVDVGCGKAELSDVLLDLKYVGADLSNIIRKVSKAFRPLLEYIEFDAELDDMKFISDFDIVFMNSFLSELYNADIILGKILRNAKKYVLIHRQEMAESHSLQEYKTYGGLKTIKYIFSVSHFDHIVDQHGFTKVFGTSCVGGLESVLLKRGGS